MNLGRSRLCSSLSTLASPFPLPVRALTFYFRRYFSHLSLYTLKCSIILISFLSFRCSGDSRVLCGTDDYASVYTLDGSVPPPPSPTPAPTPAPFDLLNFELLGCSVDSAGERVSEGEWGGIYSSRLCWWDGTVVGGVFLFGSRAYGNERQVAVSLCIVVFAHSEGTMTLTFPPRMPEVSVKPGIASDLHAHIPRCVCVGHFDALFFAPSLRV